MDEESPDDILHSHPIERGKKDISWINEVRSNLNSKQPMEHPYFACTIFRVPEHIRQLDREAYTPRVAFLGPFHHHNPYEGSAMQDYKWRCVRHLLSRHGNLEHASHLLDKCLLELKKQNKKVRSCYSEEFSTLNDQDMALIMLLDGCFIIHLLLKKHARKELSKEKRKKKSGKEEEIEEDVGKKKRGRMIETGEGGVEQLEVPTVAGQFTFEFMVYDLLKLENQIPFFIIQLLFNVLKPCEDENIDLVNLALQLFEDIRPKQSTSFKKKSSEEYHHLLHLFYSSRIPSPMSEESAFVPGCACRIIECIMPKWRKGEANRSQGTPKDAPKWIPNAMELEKAGVKFKKNKSANSFLNIKFQKRKKLKRLLCPCISRSGWMKIPQLYIYDNTSPLFRNLIAFEQCYHDTEMCITTYVLFMDCIIDQAEDVRLLRSKGILKHKLSNDQAMAELFNQLGNQIHFTCEKNYLTNQIKEVNESCDFKCCQHLAALKVPCLLLAKCLCKCSRFLLAS